MNVLNKDIEKILVKLNSKKKIDLTKLPIELLRDNYEKFSLSNSGPIINIAKVEDKKIRFNDYELQIRIYTPILSRTLPVIIFFHGGSWNFGSLSTHDAICRHLSIESDSIILAVDYRLAPEHTFPAPIEDCINIYNWTRNNIDSINGNIDKIIFAGDSAGGNIISAALLNLKSTKSKLPILQILIYPALDLNMDTESVKKYGKNYFVETNNSKVFLKNYTKDNDINNSLLSPIKAVDFSGLPKAIIIAAEFDPLKDDSINYTKKLKYNNIPVKIKIYDGMIHAFLHFIGTVKEIKPIIKEIGQLIKSELDND